MSLCHHCESSSLVLNMKTKFIYVSLFTALVTPAPQGLVTPALNSALVRSAPKGWITSDDHEECTDVHTKAMKMCLELNQVPDPVTLECQNVNRQNRCKSGMRQVIHITKECVSTKCIKNSSGGDGDCEDGKVPYNGQCHGIGTSKVCNDFTLKRTLEADMFGNVSCQCFEKYGFVNFNGDCYSESSFSPCSQGDSTQQQLIRFGYDNIGECVPNRCKAGQLMWRQPNCSETDSKTEQFLNNCFDCKNFDEHVQSCDTHLQLRNNTVTCAPNIEKNNVFDPCPHRSRKTGECIENGDKPKTARLTNKSIIRSLCRSYKQAVVSTGLQCP